MRSIIILGMNNKKYLIFTTLDFIDVVIFELLLKSGFTHKWDVWIDGGLKQWFSRFERANLMDNSSSKVLIIYSPSIKRLTWISQGVAGLL